MTKRWQCCAAVALAQNQGYPQRKSAVVAPARDNCGMNTNNTTKTPANAADATAFSQLPLGATTLANLQQQYVEASNALVLLFDGSATGPAAPGWSAPQTLPAAPLQQHP